MGEKLLTLISVKYDFKKVRVVQGTTFTFLFLANCIGILLLNMIVTFLTLFLGI